MRNDVIYFHPTSKDALPGKGRKEFVKDPRAYEELTNIPHWRQALSIFRNRPIIDMYDIRATVSDEEFSSPSSTSSSSSSSLDVIEEWSRFKEQLVASRAERVYQLHPEVRRVLELTGKAELWYGLPNKNPIRCLHLEKLREKSVV